MTDCSREIELVHRIHDDLRRVLAHVDELADRPAPGPLLTAVVERLSEKLQDAAGVVEPLVELLRDETQSEAASAPVPVPVPVTAERGDEAAAELASTADRPRRPAGRRRRRHVQVDSAEGTKDDEPPVTAVAPVYKLRKAGARDEPPQPGTPSPADEREGLERLGEFLAAAP